MEATSIEPIEDNKDDVIDGQFILPDSVIVEFEADDEATEPQIKEAAARRERSRSSSRPRRRSGISASPPLCPQSRYLLWSCIRSDSEAEPSPVLNYRRDPDSSSSVAYQVAAPPPWLGCCSGNAAAREAVALLKAKQKARSRLAEAHNTATTTSSKEHNNNENQPQQEQITTTNSNHHHVPASPEALKNRRRRRGKQVQQGVDRIDGEEDKENDKSNEEEDILIEEDEVNDTPTTVDEVIEDNKVLIEEKDNAKATAAVVEEDNIKGTPLFDSFTIWYDPGSNNANHPIGARDSEEYSRGLVRIGDIKSVEQFWQFWNSIDLMKLPKYSTLSVFKNGIQPAWEDERNQEGGRWVVKGLCRTDSKDYYSTCVLALLGNLFTAPQKMNGIVLSVRPRGNTIGLWNSVVDPELFEVIDWELRSIAPEDMQETVEVEYRDHRGAINHNMRKLGSNASHWRLCAGVAAMQDNNIDGFIDNQQFYMSDDIVGSTDDNNNTMYVPYTNYVPYTTLQQAQAEPYYYYTHSVEFNATLNIWKGKTKGIEGKGEGKGRREGQKGIEGKGEGKREN